MFNAAASGVLGVFRLFPLLRTTQWTRVRKQRLFSRIDSFACPRVGIVCMVNPAADNVTAARKGETIGDQSAIPASCQQHVVQQMRSVGNRFLCSARSLRRMNDSISPRKVKFYSGRSQREVLFWVHSIGVMLPLKLSLRGLWIASGRNDFWPPWYSSRQQRRWQYRSSRIFIRRSSSCYEWWWVQLK